MGAILSTQIKVSRVAPEDETAQAERRAALLALGCCKRRRERGQPLDLDPADKEVPQREPSSFEKALQESDGREAARGRFESDVSTAFFPESRSRWSTDDTFAAEDTLAPEGRARWGTDDTFVSEGRARWGTDDTFVSEGRARWGTDETLVSESRPRPGADDALISEGHPRFGADGALVSQGRPRFDTEDVVLKFDTIPEASAEEGATSPRDVGEEPAAHVGAAPRASTEPAAMAARAFSKESAACVSTVSGVSTEPGAMTARTFTKESAACVSTVSGVSTEPGPMTARTFTKESAAGESFVSEGSTELGAMGPAASAKESEVVPDPVFRWALSGREIDVADLAASDSVEEARSKIAKTIGSSARLLRLLGPDGQPMEGEGAIGAGGLVYGRDPDEVEREESAAAQRAAEDAVVALMRGW